MVELIHVKSTLKKSFSKHTTIAIIGAGAAGIIAAKKCMEEGLKVTVFETTNVVGGTWVYRPPNDRFASMNAMYAHLHTNLPKQVMKFKDIPFDDDVAIFPSHKEVAAYLQRVAKPIMPFIQFKTTVKKVTPKGQSWVVRTLCDSKENEAIFDCVIVANGHYAKPNMPKLSGLDKLTAYSPENDASSVVQWMHSVSYRFPEQLPEKARVLMIGAGPSGQELSKALAASRSATVYLFDRHMSCPVSTAYDDGFVHMRMGAVEHIDPNGVVHLEEGDPIQVDFVMFATGFQYAFDFLSDLSPFAISNNHVRPLYHDLFWCKDPSLCFIGLPFKVIPFGLCEYQASWAAAIYSGRLSFSEDPLPHTAPPESSLARGHYHDYGSGFQFEYCNAIAKRLHIDGVPSLTTSAYSEVHAYRHAFPTKDFRHSNYNFVSST